MKKFVSLLLAMIMVLSLAACGAKEEAPASGGSAAEPIVLKLNHPSADGGPYDLMSKEFARLIEEKTEGRYKIEIYNSNALGTQEEALEACALGTMDMCVTSDDKLATYAPEWGYLGLPFIFEDVDDVAENMNGEMGAYLSGLLEDKGLMIMSFFENGFRNVTAHKPVNVPEDLKGVKIRSVTTEGVVAFFEAAGAVVTSVSFSELYSALQLGTVDAQENPYANIRDKKFYEVQEYMTVDMHSHTAEPLVMSMATWNKLSPEDQAIFKECGLAASEWAYQYAKDTDADNRAYLEENMTVIDPDMGPWLALAEKTNAEFLPKYEAVAALKK